MKAIQLPDFITTEVAGRLLMIRTTNPHYIGEVVRYQNGDELAHATGLLNTEDIPYAVYYPDNMAIIFSGAMGKVPMRHTLHMDMTSSVFQMLDFYLTHLKT